MLCGHCGEPVDPGDDDPIPSIDGMMHRHRACAFRMIVGGLNHQLGLCICCGGTEPPDPPEMTVRQAAEAAARHWMLHKRPAP